MSFSRKLEFVTSLKKNLFDVSLIDFFLLTLVSGTACMYFD
jgi:hypothetical protein